MSCGTNWERPEYPDGKPAPPDKHVIGLYHKFSVSRTDGSDAPGKKHHGCEYFVLDVTHDKHAIPALKAYADSCAAEYPGLAKDLRAMTEPNNDRHYATIKVDHLDIEGSPLCLWLTWYKSRGHTDAMWLLFADQPPRQPTEAECLMIGEAYHG